MRLTDLDRRHLDVVVQLIAEISDDEAVDEQEYAERHHQALTESARMQITVVPTILIGDRRIEGLATEGVIRRAIDKAVA